MLRKFPINLGAYFFARAIFNHISSLRMDRHKYNAALNAMKESARSTTFRASKSGAFLPNRTAHTSFIGGAEAVPTEGLYLGFQFLVKLCSGGGGPALGFSDGNYRHQH